MLCNSKEVKVFIVYRPLYVNQMNLFTPWEIHVWLECGAGLIFVDEEIVIDGPFHDKCILEFQTQENRILAFSVFDGDMKEIQSSFLVTMNWTLTIN
jgi:hypothetical protein